MFRTLHFEDFEKLVGGAFTICDAEGAPRIALTLSEATPLSAHHGVEGVRPPFSLIFLGPGDVILPQNLYQLQHDALGAITILLVPVGRDAQGVSYQSLFN